MTTNKMQVVIRLDEKYSEMLRKTSADSKRSYTAEARLRLEASLTHYSSIADVQNTVFRKDDKRFHSF